MTKVIGARAGGHSASPGGSIFGTEGFDGGDYEPRAGGRSLQVAPPDMEGEIRQSQHWAPLHETQVAILERMTEDWQAVSGKIIREWGVAVSDGSSFHHINVLIDNNYIEIRDWRELMSPKSAMQYRLNPDRPTHGERNIRREFRTPRYKITDKQQKILDWLDDEYRYLTGDQAKDIGGWNKRGSANDALIALRRRGYIEVEDTKDTHKYRYRLTGVGK